MAQHAHSLEETLHVCRERRGIYWNRLVSKRRQRRKVWTDVMKNCKRRGDREKEKRGKQREINMRDRKKAETERQSHIAAWHDRDYKESRHTHTCTVCRTVADSWQEDEPTNGRTDGSTLTETMHKTHTVMMGCHEVLTKASTQNTALLCLLLNVTTSTVRQQLLHPPSLRSSISDTTRTAENT